VHQKILSSLKSRIENIGANRFFFVSKSEEKRNLSDKKSEEKNFAPMDPVVFPRILKNKSHEK
jgi:hypothetical protein